LRRLQRRLSDRGLEVIRNEWRRQRLMHVLAHKPYECHPVECFPIPDLPYSLQQHYHGNKQCPQSNPKFFPGLHGNRQHSDRTDDERASTGCVHCLARFLQLQIRSVDADFYNSCRRTCRGDHRVGHRLDWGVVDHKELLGHFLGLERVVPDLGNPVWHFQQCVGRTTVCGFHRCILTWPGAHTEPRP